MDSVVNNQEFSRAADSKPHEQEGHVGWLYIHFECLVY